MRKFSLILFFVLCLCSYARADISEYRHSFDVSMDMDLSDLDKYIQKLKQQSKGYDRGYRSRYDMGNKFKSEFSKTIKSYGISENRIKSSYEDNMLEMVNMMPKETYPYIGPMLHEIPGMSEKILNLPGIKETKNKFPENIDEKFKAVEDIEFISPALYFVLMPRKQEKADLDKPENKPVKKNKKHARVPDFSFENKPSPDKNAKGDNKIVTTAIDQSRRTIFPTLTSPLTTADAEAFLSTMDEVIEWGKPYLPELIRAGIVLDYIEQEKGTAITQNSLKDVVNPCQNFVLKTRVAGIYPEFQNIVAKKGFNPEEWAYTCDKTFKALRINEANHSTAYAVQFHRRGYYDDYIKLLPEKWQKGMFETGAAVVAMYSALKSDVEAVKPIKKDILNKIIENEGLLLTMPIIY